MIVFKGDHEHTFSNSWLNGENKSSGKAVKFGMLHEPRDVHVGYRTSSVKRVGVKHLRAYGCNHEYKNTD
jgi:hypothetical protein